MAKIQTNVILTRYHGFHGTKHNAIGNSDSGVHYMIFDQSKSPLYMPADKPGFDDAAIRDLWYFVGGNPDKLKCSHEHDCCACYFQSDVAIERRRNRVIVTQSWGINI